jgi:ParB/RepB/Spo0J family partition protein
VTSGEFSSYPISSIFVDRAERQRRTIKEDSINDLAASINRRGLINPIVITREGKLIAGETRLLACTALGWTSISVQWSDDLDPIELKLIELEENVKRSDLTWQEECMALLELHELNLSLDADWTQQRTADIVGYSSMHVGRMMEVGRELQSGNEKVISAEKFSVAHNAVQRSAARKRTSTFAELDKVTAEVAQADQPEKEQAALPQVPIINADFHEWQKSYVGPKFNLIHCDFPYGINVADAPRQNSAIKDYYEDSPDIYRQLMTTLGLAMDNVVAESAHLIFWFDMGFYTETKEALESFDWKVIPHPLIWHKLDNAGVAPDPQRLPRRTYETAFFGIRGERLLTSAGTKSNSFGFPGKRGEDDHVSEKPIPVLKHFMSMVCDEYSSIFDPTAGSGNAIRIGEDLGARHALGLELNPEFFERTITNWRKDNG